MRNAASGTRDAGRRSGTKEEGWPADFRLSQTHRNRGRLGVWVERSRDSSLRYFNNLRGISAIRPTSVSADGCLDTLTARGRGWEDSVGFLRQFTIVVRLGNLLGEE